MAVNREQQDAVQVVRCGMCVCWRFCFYLLAIWGRAKPLRCCTALSDPRRGPDVSPAGRPPGDAGLMLCWRWWAAPRPWLPLMTCCAQEAPSPLLAATQVGRLSPPQAALQVEGASPCGSRSAAVAAPDLVLLPGLEQPDFIHSPASTLQMPPSPSALWMATTRTSPTALAAAPPGEAGAGTAAWVRAGRGRAGRRLD